VLEECGALVLRGVEEGEVLEPHRFIVARAVKVGAAGAARFGLQDDGLQANALAGPAGRQGCS
jgi:hypothetical protein